jgi:hypothetical protein
MDERGEAPAIRDDGLQLDEPRRSQERFWTAERWAWITYGLLVLAALAGLTGSGGPLSRAEVTLGTGAIEYPRIARWQAADDMTVTFSAGTGERSLTLGRAFAKSFGIEDVQPAPERSEALPEGQRLVFRLPGGGPAQVRLYLRPSSPGLARFEAALDGAPPLSLSVFVLP